MIQKTVTFLIGVEQDR